MRLVTFEVGKIERVGIWIEEIIIDVVTVYSRLQKQGLKCPSGEVEQFPPTLLALLDLGQAGLEVAKWVVTKVKEDLEYYRRAQGEPLVYEASKVRLRAPLPLPRKLFCVAENYEEHIKESGRRDLIYKEKGLPRVFMKPSTNTVIGPGEPIIISKRAQSIDWEAELAVIIGKRGKYISAIQAMDYVAGYTIFNDVSERQLRVREQEPSTERDRFFAWLNGKWLDSFAPMGPCLVTKEEIEDPQNLNIVLRVNGQIKQNSNTRFMIFRIVDLIEYLSQVVTLEPGDVIATGTPSGVGFPKGERLQPGDLVEIEIEKIGILSNPVQAE